MEQDNLVSKWLNNTFKIKSEALDLRSTPTASLSPILAPGFAPGGMTTDIQQQANNRSLFSKMNTDFWQQARGPPLMPHSLNLLNNSSPTTTTPTNLSGPLTNTPSTQGSSSSPTLTGSGSILSPSNLHHHLALMQQQHQNNMPNQQSTSIQNALMNLATGNLGAAGPNANNNANTNTNNNQNNGMNTSNPAMNTNLDQKFDHLSNVQNLQMALAAQQQQQQQNNAQQTQQLNTNNSNANANNNTNHNLNNNQQQSSVNTNNNPPPPPQSATPGGSSTPDIKMSAEKLVNEFQVSPNFFYLF